MATTPQLPPALRHQAIAELLRAGATYEQIRAQIGGGSQTLIAAVRRAEGIPPLPRPRPCRTPEETYALYAEPYGDGHARWAGTWAGRMPQIQHPGPRGRGRKESALRVAFRWRHGREPEGRVKPGCGDRTCVASGHLTDRIIREQLRQQQP